MKNFLLLAIASIFTSSIIVSFLELCQIAVDTFIDMTEHTWWLPLIWTPTLTMLIVFITNRFAPGTAGSGNQQIKAALDDQCDDQTRSKFVSLKVAVFKYFSTVMGFFAGLSIGREGPTVQIASSLMYSIRKFFPQDSKFTSKFLISVGGAIGLAVAFKAIIAGTVFALEESANTVKRNSRVMYFTMITFAVVTCFMLEGFHPFYTNIDMPTISLDMIMPLIVTVLIGAVLGGLFARCLLASMPNRKTLLGIFKSNHPIILAGILGLVIAVIGILCGGITYSDGYNYTKGTIIGSQDFSLWFVPLKFIATWFTAWTGVPAGMFSPLLSIGAGIGNTVGEILSVNPTLLLMCGMTSFLSAVIRAPLTSGFLAVEVLGAYTMIPLALLVSLLSDKISDHVSPPLWLTQKNSLLYNTKK